MSFIKYLKEKTDYNWISSKNSMGNYCKWLSGRDDSCQLGCKKNRTVKFSNCPYSDESGEECPCYSEK